MIEVRDLTFRYGRGFVLGPVSLSVVGPGVTALMGPNGAGKSTLVRLLCGVTTARSGSIRVDGASVAPGRSGRAAKGRVGYVPQVLDFPPRARVLQVLHHAAWLRGVPSAHAVGTVTRALEAVDLAERADSRVRTLSGGMCRRLSIAQALVHEPTVLVLDEPTSGLDPQQRLTMRSHLSTLSVSTTVLIATHLAEDVQALAGQVVVLGQGQVAFDGSLDSLLARAPEAIAGMSRIDAALSMTLGTHPDEQSRS